MIFNLLFISSYSSQLGGLVSLIRHNKINYDLNNKYIFIIFQLNTKSDEKCEYTVFEKDLLKNYFSNSKIFRFKINNFYKRLVLWFVLFVSSPLLFKKNIRIWQTRPDWIKNIFSLGKISLPLIIPKKNIYYCGDGFLSLCKSAIPFWLRNKSKTKEKRDLLEIDEENTFYYLYSINYQKPTINDIKIPSKFIREIITEITTKKNNITQISLKKKELKNKTKSLLIFPTSTFYETSRCNLNEEINLYFEFINEQININTHFICVKPHPGSSRIKTFTLEKKLSDYGYELLNWRDYNNLGKIFTLPLEVIPLELFISLLVNQLGLKYEKLLLIVSSNASLSCLILYPKLNYLYAFTSRLINKYLDTKFKSQRLDQEDFIKEYIEKKLKINNNK